MYCNVWVWVNIQNEQFLRIPSKNRIRENRCPIYSSSLKSLKKTAMACLEEHIVDNNLHDPSQSAYKKCHSTETALLKINNDILYNKHCIILASLDLSAAFDTGDHTILLHRLQNDFGIEGKALQWFTSLITGGTQRVCIDGNSSDLHQLICGVPQRSVLGARMYTMYTQMLASVIRKHDVQLLEIS